MIVFLQIDGQMDSATTFRFYCNLETCMFHYQIVGGECNELLCEMQGISEKKIY